MRLGLMMIVKDEKHVILRCLKSVSSIIDYWTIVDTGSTDGTQNIIKDYFKEKNIPGELIEIEWKDFSTSRNAALMAIEPHVDYAMWIDADEELIIDNTIFDKEKTLKGDAIAINTMYNGILYSRKSIIKTNIGYKWYGPVHEILIKNNEKEINVADGIFVLVKAEGNSWKNIKNKYSEHAKILEEYIKTDDDPRWIFYLAQSYRDSDNYEKALEYYQKRQEIKKGHQEEIFYSKFMMGSISYILKKDEKDIIYWFLNAHEFDPLRGEPIKSLSKYYFHKKSYDNMFIFAQYGLIYNMKNPYPKRSLFLDTDIYDYEMLEIYSIACYHTGRKKEGTDVYWKMREQISKFPQNRFTSQQMNVIYNNEKYFKK